MISFEKAKAIVLKESNALFSKTRTQVVPLDDSLGRVISDSINSPIAVPLFDNSAMDGFALKSDVTKNADPTNPVTLKISGEIQAGDPPFELLDTDSTIRIMTGAPIPKGADCVIKKEDVEEINGVIKISESVKEGNNIRLKGEDIKAGESAIPQGTRITPGIAGFLSSIGIQRLNVFSHPGVSILVTGNELVDSLENLGPGKILESNSSVLKMGLKEMGVLPHRIQILKDDPSLLKKSAADALEDSDIIIISGGVSVGEHDHTKKILKKLGVKEQFWKVAQKPGKPFYFGTLNDRLVYGLPGNPYAVFTCFYLYIRPSILSMMGDKSPELKNEFLPLNRNIKKKGHRSNFLKGKRQKEDGIVVAEPLMRQGSHLLSSLTKADLLIEFPADCEDLKKGESVKVYYLP